MRNIFFLLVLISSLANAQFSNPQINVLDIQEYSFHIILDDTSNLIKARSIAKIHLLQNTDSIYLDLINSNEKGDGMRVISVRDEFRFSLRHKHKEDRLIIYNPGNWNVDKPIQVEVIYEGKPVDGLYISKSMYGNKTFFGDNWPNRARHWLPVVDHPSDKAYVEFFINAPAHYKVIASGNLVSKDTLMNSKYAYHFRTNQELPTKVMVLGAADFKVKMLDTINNIPVSSWIYKEASDEGFDDYKPAVSVLQYFDSIIGKYPYEKLANVQSKTRFGGMENAGNIFYYEESVNGKHQVESLVTHEVAHQWFGNFVTEKNWRDIWLSEGFATYLTDLYLEHTYGKEKLKERMLMEREKVIKYAKNPNVQPIVYDEKDNLFKLLNRNSYEKGAWVLHMLRNKIGDKNFFIVLKDFYKTYKGKNAATEDFIALAESNSGQDLKVFFDQWLYRSDIPVLDIDYYVEKRQLYFSIKQKNKPFEFTIPIQIYNKKKWQSFDLKITKKQHTYMLPVKIKAKNLKVLIDPEVNVLFEEEKTD